ncbi:IS110 family transposase [Thalassotalea sp. ND16A]|uniref:IS110 family transposase n=1 Tax=Thalassotalea sp. ND16A TaxID=1535422 RepID=UPI00051A29AC|nr:IS110 family transposase [Thalassotalea sp. ND16A]KGJ90635.1 hypothetical protein ND16A_1842 [Thalassotalea sp. ND16A]
MKNSSINHIKDCVGIGIDVSKDSLSFAEITEDKTYITNIENSISSIDLVAQKLMQENYQGKVICESTGHYHLKIVSVFSKYKLNLLVLNPLQSSKHSKANIRKVKSDPADAETLGIMCITEKNLPKPTELSDSKILIRLKMGQLASLEKFIQRLQSSVNAYHETYEGLKFKESDVQRDLAETLSKLKKTKGRMTRELERLISDLCVDDHVINDIQEIPGVSEITAALISQFDTDVKDANSWVAYVGYDVSVRQSGKWKGRGKLTKRGNSYLRKRLWGAAWGAMRHDEHFKAYYDQLRGNGRSYVAALCILAKKILRIAYQIMVNHKKYDPNIAFPA